jgi:hypothetical protein
MGMKVTIRLFIFIVCLAGAIVFLPASVQAANTTRTLQPGRVYTFTGRDARVISNITVSGVGRYQFVSFDGRGDVISYGFSFGQIAVRGDGFTQVTPLAALSVTFNTTRLTLREAEGNALRQINLTEGQTLAIENQRRASLHIRTNQASPYDAAVFNAAGGVAFLDRDIRFPQLSIPGNGEAMITARGGLTVYFPAGWDGVDVAARWLTHPAIATHVLREGEAYALLHTGESGATLAVEPLYTTAVFSYDFILRDRQGFATSHGEAASSRIALQPHRSLTITPHMDAELFFPYALHGELTVGAGGETPAFYGLEPGQSLTIVNASATRFHNVNLASEPGGYPFVYDFTLETEEGIAFGAQTAAGTHRLPPGGVLTLTAGQPPDWAPQVLAVRFPESDDISFKAAFATVARHTLNAGASVIIANEGEGSLSLAVRLMAENPARAVPAALDYVLKGPDGEIVSFGQRLAGTDIALEPGYAIHLTNPEGDGPMGLFFPAAWRAQGLTIVRSDAPALVRRTLEAGETLRFDNVNPRYNRRLRIESAANERGVVFDYVLTDNRNAILSYGIPGTGIFNLRHNSRLTITSADALTVSYPAEWHHNSIRTAAAASPPLHRITLRPGEQVALRNNTGTDFILSNDSAPDGAGYHTRTGSDVRPPVRIPSNEPPSHGPIPLPSATNMVLAASRGADLHIWMPWARARQLRLV